MNERPVKQNQQQANGHGQCEGPHQQGHLGEVIAFAPGLGRQPGGAHPHKAERPVQDAEKIGPHGDRAQVLRAFQVAKHGGIHQTQQRYRQVGEHQWPGQRPEAPVGDGK